MEFSSVQCDNQKELHFSFAQPRYKAMLAVAPKPDHIVAANEKVSDDWIKCSERMPEIPYHQEQLIVYTDSMIVMAAWFNRIDLVFKEEHNGCVIDDVTHWMPLPDVPKPE